MNLIFSQRHGKGDEYTGFTSGLTAICHTFFFNEADIFLGDGYDGRGDGLVKFEVRYNDFHHDYEFHVIGGTRWEKKATALKKWFKDRKYKVTQDSTWRWGEIDGKSVCHRGAKLTVKAKKFQE